jgi:ATP-dependent helicase/nuclease subunit B
VPGNVARGEARVVDAQSATIGGVSSALYAALATGAVAVTPNRRLARYLRRRFDALQQASGRSAWPTPTILPYAAWLEQLWREAFGEDALTRHTRLLTPAQSLYLWDRIVADATSRTAPLIDPRGTAKLGAEAWTLIHAWGGGGESWRAWSGTEIGGDPATFADWAAAYSAALGRRDALDHSQLADVLVGCAGRMPAWRERVILLTGFIELTPQQSRLLAALEGIGTHIARHDLLAERSQHARRVAAATPRDELALAFAWARAQAVTTPDATIGIAIEDLAKRRAEVQALADAILCPDLQWPGMEEAPRPYNLSLGIAVGDVPSIMAALDLIGLGQTPLPVERVAPLLRSAYLNGASSGWTRRAAIERRWLEQGRHKISVGDAIHALGACDDPLALRWRTARDRQRQPSSATAREWVEIWRAWLSALGWPGDRALSSAEHQAHAAWDEMLTEFAGLGVIETRLSRYHALAALRAMAADKLFQPETPETPVQILGVLEASGMPFDALWVAGLAAERWPPPPQPNPLLPLAWQRERNLPRSTAGREFSFARALTDQFLRAAPTVILSHAIGVDDHQRTPSALIVGLAALDGAAGVATRSYAETTFALRPTWAKVRDDTAPALPPGSRAPGGARLIENQSDCPFRAVATNRLRVEPWPEPLVGLSPIERGHLVHQTLAAFWRDVRDHATLSSLSPDALQMRIAAAARLAIATGAVPVSRWRGLPPIVSAGEGDRIAKVVRRWLDEFERVRPPFTIRGAEVPVKLKLSDLSFSLRLDRVDDLAGGGVAVIDYKTGPTADVNAWFDARPQSPQLALYALAQRVASPSEPVRAVAYAQLRAAELRLRGLAADATAWPGLARPEAIWKRGFTGWSDVEARWTELLTMLATEVADGYAVVAPRKIEKTCRRCRLWALCRIGKLSRAEGNEGADG